MITQKLYRNGNSVAVTIPKEYLESLDLKEGTEVLLDQEQETIVIVSKRTKAKSKSTITPEFLKWLDDFNQEYGPALKELAKR